MKTASPPFQAKSPPYDRLKDLRNYSELKRLVYGIVTLQQKKQFRTLAILSFFPAEGKTLFCAAMAMAFVETCRSRVLVVDATTYHSPNSLILKECLDPSISQIDFLSLSERQMESKELQGRPLDARHVRDKPSVDAVAIEAVTTEVSLTNGSDHALINHVASEKSKHYGLVLLDTVPLTVKNKGNIDPLLAANMSDASVLIVSRKLLQAPDLRARLKMLEDPALHLIGMISNEDFIS